MAKVTNLLSKAIPAAVTLTTTTVVLQDITAMDWSANLETFLNKSSNRVYGEDAGNGSADYEVTFSTKDVNAARLALALGTKYANFSATFTKVGDASADLVLGLATSASAKLKGYSSGDDNNTKVHNLTLELISADGTTCPLTVTPSS